MTSAPPRRVMVRLSLFPRIAVSAPVVLLLTAASAVSAQVPVLAPPEPAPAEPSAPASTLTPPAAAPPSAPLPPAPAAPPAAAPAPPAGSATPSAPQPAKTDRLALPDSAAPALDDDDDEFEDRDEGPRRRWYGWQTLTADAASILVVVAGASLEAKRASEASSALVRMGLVGYEFAPGILHFAHGNPGRGFGSFGMRLGMPLAGAFIGASAASGCDGFLCEAGGAAVGLLLGMGGAIAIDAAVFAYDDARIREADDAGLRPLLVLAPQSAWVGLGGKL